MSNEVIMAFSLTLFAGLATGVGSAIAFFAKTTNHRFLAISLGFSAGVMIYVSLVEIFWKAKDALTASMGDKAGNWATVLAFFGGIALIAIIDKFIPEFDNPHEVHDPELIKDQPTQAPDHSALHRTGIFVALAIALHNFPEGLATFIGALHDPKLGLAIAVAIAIHNIPEGISVSVPIYYATKNKSKAFFYSLLSGLAEPVGAIVGYTILRPFMSSTLFGLLFASVAGIMVFISIDELLPSAEKYGDHHFCIYGFIAGMAVMALSLLMFL